MAVTMKNGVFWDVTPRDSCKNRCARGTWHLHVSEELSASIIRVTRIGELGITLAVTLYFFAGCVGCYLQLTLFLVHRFLSP
jgi:hypothetical protein